MKHRHPVSRRLPPAPDAAQRLAAYLTAADVALDILAQALASASAELARLRARFADLQLARATAAAHAPDP